jgi:hypothetical protein
LEGIRVVDAAIVGNNVDVVVIVGVTASGTMVSRLAKSSALSKLVLGSIL